jgi:hypothetical protein
LEAKKNADLADIYYIPMAAHNVSSPIATLAACHALATMRNFMILEFHAQDIEWWDDVAVGNAPFVQNGYITLPDKPGLGLELNEEVARAHRRLIEGMDRYANSTVVVTCSSRFYHIFPRWKINLLITDRTGRKPILFSRKCP